MRGGSSTRSEVGGKLHLLPHLGISRVAHLLYIERSERERETERGGGGRERDEEKEKDGGTREWRKR